MQKSPKATWLATVMIWLSAALAWAAPTMPLWAKWLSQVILLGVLLFIWSRPSGPQRFAPDGPTTHFATQNCVADCAGYCSTDQFGKFRLPPFIFFVSFVLFVVKGGESFFRFASRTNNGIPQTNALSTEIDS